MNYIIRNKSLITEKSNLEHLYTMKKFPVFMGCVDDPKEKDLNADMVWDICRDTGLIQLRKLIPLDILYLNQHNDGIGKVWHDHYVSFANFVNEYSPTSILEIGGAHDSIASHFLKLNPKAHWTIVEPNPQNIKNKKIKIIKNWFDDKFITNEKYDAVVHSHVFEHVYNPIDFIKNINKFIKIGDYHIFSFPNLLPMLKKKFTNVLNFEHTLLLTEDIADSILEKNGFKIIEKKYFGNPHSIFYATQKISSPIKTYKFKNQYTENKKVFTEFIKHYEKEIKNLNSKIKQSPGPIFLFGAHIFSQFLLSFGLSSKKIESIIDNSQTKQDKRLYGTNFIIKSPEILKNKGEVNVILRAGSYDDEIKKQLLTINKKTIIW